MSPAHSFAFGSHVGAVYDSIRVRSSRFHVLPTEKDPLAFSFDLCMRTRPDLRTAMMITRAFSESGVRAVGGGGAAGWDENSTMRMCVMYVSCIEPSGSFLPKHVSMMRRFSSSNRSARLEPGPAPAPFPRSIGGAVAAHEPAGNDAVNDDSRIAVVS